MNKIARFGVIALTAILAALNRITSRKRRDHSKTKLIVLATGTFYSDNWLLAHLLPLSKAATVKTVFFVSVRPIPDIPNVIQVTPPAWLTAVTGTTISRLLGFVHFAFKHRPDVILGFHLLLNGIVAKLLAGTTRCRSVYICGGGKREFGGGGYETENRLFRLLGRPSQYVEKHLLEFVRGFDLTVVMGSTVRNFLKEEVGVRGDVMINPGGYDGEMYQVTDSEKQFDLMLIGRLSTVKQVDHFLGLISRLKPLYPNVSAVIVGDGPSRADLETLTETLGLCGAVKFAGWQSDVSLWIKLSRIFVLTSSSEGVSQAMIQAMMCGVPPIVPDVGDLADFVESGSNGRLYAPGDAAGLLAAAEEMLLDPDYSRRLGKAAATTGSQCTYGAAAKLWDQYLRL